MRERLLGVGADLSRVYVCDDGGTVVSADWAAVFHWDDLTGREADAVDNDGGDTAAEVARGAGVSVADLLAAWQYVERLRASVGDGFKLFDESATCPVCGGVDVSGWEFEAEDTQAWQEVSCDDCGSRWNDVYVMAGRAEIRPGSRVALAVLRNRDAVADRRGLADADQVYDNAHRCGGCGVTGGGVENGRCEACAMSAAVERRVLSDWIDAAYEDRNGCGVEL